MELTDILLACILFVLVREQFIKSEWVQSRRRNWRRRNR